jgi:hypothetical protein
LVLPSEGELDVGEGMTACEGKVVTVPEPEVSLFATRATISAA